MVTDLRSCTHQHLYQVASNSQFQITYKAGSGADCWSALNESKIHGHTRQETLEMETDLRVFLDGKEKPTRIFRCKTCSALQPGHRKGICVDPGLKHSFLEVQSPQSRSAGKDG